jgi:hypothetical protein
VGAEACRAAEETISGFIGAEEARGQLPASSHVPVVSRHRFPSRGMHVRPLAVPLGMSHTTIAPQ